MEPPQRDVQEVAAGERSGPDRDHRRVARLAPDQTIDLGHRALGQTRAGRGELDRRDLRRHQRHAVERQPSALPPERRQPGAGADPGTGGDPRRRRPGEQPGDGPGNRQQGEEPRDHGGHAQRELGHGVARRHQQAQVGRPGDAVVGDPVGGQDLRHPRDERGPDRVQLVAPDHLPAQAPQAERAADRGRRQDEEPDRPTPLRSGPWRSTSAGSIRHRSRLIAHDPSLARVPKPGRRPAVSRHRAPLC